MRWFRSNTIARPAPRLRVIALAVLAAAVGFAAGTSAKAETLNEALASAYNYSPRLYAERARLRGADEDVARAMSGFRPKINLQGEIRSVKQETEPPLASDGRTNPKSLNLNATQEIFSGLSTVNAVNEADAKVRAAQEQLRVVEQEILLSAAQSYMDVIRDLAILRLREDNVRVLSKELKATQDRFAVGEVTKTDVAQAQARRALAVSGLELARANVKTTRGNFEAFVGHPPSGLAAPSGFEAGLPSSLDEAIGRGIERHPTIISALFTEQAARINVDKIRGGLYPRVDLEADFRETHDPSRFIDEQEVTTVTGRVTMPLYEGGEIYAQVRQAKHNHVGSIQDIEQARAVVRAQVTQAWSQHQAAKAKLISDTAQVNANQTALAGVREEERVGQRTLLDVLDAELELLTSQVTLETTKRDLVVSAYTLRQTIGAMDAISLGTNSIVYDPSIHADEVHDKWIGTRITHEDPWHADVVTEPVK